MDIVSGTSGAFRFTGNMSLQHIRSSKCMHPFWGCPVPSQGEDLVLHSTCDEERLAFMFIRGTSDNLTSSSVKRLNS